MLWIHVILSAVLFPYAAKTAKKVALFSGSFNSGFPKTTKSKTATVKFPTELMVIQQIGPNYHFSMLGFTQLGKLARDGKTSKTSSRMVI